VANYGNGIEARWPATITRITGNIDSETGTIGIVVRVADAGFPDPETRRPALLNGSFVEVVLEGPPLEDQIAVPQSAIRFEGSAPYLLVADSDDRLARRDVSIGAEIDGRYVVMNGLSVGDRVVLSDPRPAANGLLLDLVESDVRP